jgi:hypothetical protein
MAKTAQQPKDLKVLFSAASMHSFASGVLFLHSHMRLTAECEDQPPKPPSLPCSVPGVILSAFAIELYLKCLRWVVNTPPYREHTLKDLYNGLPLTEKTEIRDRFDEIVKDTNALANLPTETTDGIPYGPTYYGFDESLGRLSEAFKEWRYFYGSSPKRVGEFGLRRRV